MKNEKVKIKKPACRQVKIRKLNTGSTKLFLLLNFDF